MASLRTLTALAAFAALPITASAQLTYLGSFAEAGLNALDGAGYDPSTNTVYVHEGFGTIARYTPAGAPLGTLPSPNSTNDLDLDFAPVAMNIGGTSVPAGSLLFTGGEGVATIWALDKVTGAVLASVGTTAGSGLVVGGSYSPVSGTQFLVNYSSDTIFEINTTTGATVNSFAVRPAGSPTFDIFYGDIEVMANGNLLLAGSSQNTIRELTSTGSFVQDYTIAGAPAGSLAGFSGLALDDASGTLYISDVTTDRVHIVNGFTPVPEPATMAALGLGALALLRRRKRA